MIYTVTLNPSIDYVIKVENLKNGRVNRVDEENVYPGGKGINVSRVLKNLGGDSTCLGFVSDFTGQYIVDSLKSMEICSDFIKVKDGFTRINVKIKSSQETEINGKGPNISTEEINQLFSIIDKLTEEDVLILAGSIPGCLDESLYEYIMKMLDGKNIKIIVDTTKNLLLNVLKYKPFLIKPNNHELEEIFDVKLNSIEDIVSYATKLKDLGARNVLVSMGKDGALLLTEDNRVFISNVAKGEVINSVGAGDSMVAGFIYAYLQTNDYKESLKLGSASGSATAFSSDLATREYIYELLNQIEVKEIQL